MKFSTFNSFKKQVARLLKSRLGMNINDISEDSLRESFESGWAPSEHVDMIGAMHG